MSLQTAFKTSSFLPLASIPHDQRVAMLEDQYGHLQTGTQTLELLNRVIHDDFPGSIAQVSSFGAEAALLLAFIAEVAPDTPVLFLDTLKHFPETLIYRDRLIETLKLTDVRTIQPNPVDLLTHDSDGNLHKTDPDTCCHLRKVVSLDKALSGFDAWINGRKRIHGHNRSSVSLFEHDKNHLKVTPLAFWTKEDIQNEWDKRGLPEHPLALEGYTSIGCAPCTAKPLNADDPRSGRWAGTDKKECKLHPDYFKGMNI